MLNKIKIFFSLIFILNSLLGQASIVECFRNMMPREALLELTCQRTQGKIGSCLPMSMINNVESFAFLKGLKNFDVVLLPDFYYYLNIAWSFNNFYSGFDIEYHSGSRQLLFYIFLKLYGYKHISFLQNEEMIDRAKLWKKLDGNSNFSAFAEIVDEQIFEFKPESFSLFDPKLDEIPPHKFNEARLNHYHYEANSITGISSPQDLRIYIEKQAIWAPLFGETLRNETLFERFQKREKTYLFFKPLDHGQTTHNLFNNGLGMGERNAYTKEEIQAILDQVNYSLFDPRNFNDLMRELELHIKAGRTVVMAIPGHGMTMIGIKFNSLMGGQILVYDTNSAQNITYTFAELKEMEAVDFSVIQ